MGISIANWPLEKKMQLPDWCFGSKWPVGLGIRTTVAGQVFEISQKAYPEWIVLWEIILMCHSTTDSTVCCCATLAHSLATAITQMRNYEQLFTFSYRSVMERYVLRTGGKDSYKSIKMRQPINTKGRRLMANFNVSVADETQVELVTIVSSLPTEIPEWLR